MRLIKEMVRTLLKLLFHIDMDSQTEDLLKEREEKETLNAINKIGFKGRILDIAAGDGRFNEELLKVAKEVIAIDINEN